MSVDEDFRTELKDWLATHLLGDFAKHPGVGGPADDSMWELRMEWERLLANDRWLNISWPVEYGGRGGTATQELIFHMEHSAAGAPYWCGVQGRDLLGPMLLEYANPAIQQRFLPAITSMQEFWGQGFSEPNAGSDLAGLLTRADRDGDDWVINGQKIWMTFGKYADWMYVLCRTDRESQRHRGLSMLLIDAHQPGVDVRAIRNMAGGREFAEVFFTDARTPVDMVVGEPGQGWGVVMGTLGNERAGVTVLPFQAAFEREMRQLIVHVQLTGQDRDPIIRQQVAKAFGGLRILQLNNQRMFETVYKGGHPGPESSINKLYWANWHRDFGELAANIAGAASLIVGPDYALTTVQHTFLNSRAETIYGGANEIQRNIVGERVLGLPK